MVKILIVEDEQNIRDTLVEILETQDYSVIEATNGLNGSIKAIKEKPDLIISDVSMPEMDGFQLLEALNACMDKLIVPPFIFLTAHVERQDIRRGMDLGADDYLTKPFKAKELLAAVKSKLVKRNQIQKQLLNKDRLAISMELHDGVQQLLVASKMGFESITGQMENLDSKEYTIYKSALGLLTQATMDLRSYVHNVQDRIEISDLPGELKELAKNTEGLVGISVEIQYSTSKILNTMIQTQLYKITQEAISNIIKHSKAKNVQISLVEKANAFEYSINDDGIGFNVNSDFTGVGVASISKRVKDIGGTLQIESVPGDGTTLVVNFA